MTSRASSPFGVAALAAVTAMALLVAGCGSKSSTPSTSATGSTSSATTTTVRPPAPAKPVRLAKHTYELRMQAIGRRIGRSLNNLYPLSSGTKGSDAAAHTIAMLERTEALVGSLLAQLKQIIPPGRVAAQHRQLEAGLRQLMTQLTQEANFARTGNVGRFVAGSNFTSSLATIDAAANEMTNRGYNIIGPNAALNP